VLVPVVSRREGQPILASASRSEEVPIPEPSEVLDVGDAARLLGIDVDELVPLTVRGDLRPVPHGRPIRIRKRELEAFLNSRRLL
jgi:hypothetical protein